jgi:hypothetical protein
MARVSGFRELADDLEFLAQDFEQAAEEQKQSSSQIVRGRDPLSGQFITLKDAVAGGISKTLRDTTIPQASAEAQEYLPSSSDRGRSSNPQISQRSGDWQGDRYNHLFYSTNDLVAHHEFGTGTHGNRGSGSGYVIEPRDADALSFYWDKIGMQVTFNYVVHPGVEGQHFMQRALLQSTGDMKRNIAERIENMEFSDF